MYRIEISHDERILLQFAIGIALPQLVHLVDGPESAYVPILNLMRRLLEAPKLPEGQASAPMPQPAGMPAAVATARAPATRKSPEPPAPEREKKAELLGELTITPEKVDQPPDGASMVVHYRIRTANQVRMTKMHCWDPTQFGTLLETVGKPTTFLTKATKTGFVNIIGVKKA